MAGIFINVTFMETNVCNMDRSQRLWMLALLMAVLMGACTSRTEKTVTELDKLLGELRVEYAPDERTAWWHPSAGVVDKEVVLSGEVDKPLAYEAIISEVDARFPEVKNELRLLPEGDDGVVVNGLVNNSVIHLRGGTQQQERAGHPGPSGGSDQDPENRRGKKPDPGTRWLPGMGEHGRVACAGTLGAGGIQGS
jgi:hypothetical protein